MSLGAEMGDLIVDYVVDSRLKMSGMTEGWGGNDGGVGGNDRGWGGNELGVGDGSLSVDCVLDFRYWIPD